MKTTLAILVLLLGLGGAIDQDSTIATTPAMYEMDSEDLVLAPRMHFEIVDPDGTVTATRLPGSSRAYAVI